MHIYVYIYIYIYEKGLAQHARSAYNHYVSHILPSALVAASCPRTLLHVAPAFCKCCCRLLRALFVCRAASWHIADFHQPCSTIQYKGACGAKFCIVLCIHSRASLLNVGRLQRGDRFPRLRSFPFQVICFKLTHAFDYANGVEIASPFCLELSY
jgi:hypothetical protein